MSLEWGNAVNEYKHEIVVLVGLVIILKLFLAITGQMPLFSFSFVDKSNANIALAAGAQATDDMSRIYGSN